MMDDDIKEMDEELEQTCSCQEDGCQCECHCHGDCHCNDHHLLTDEQDVEHFIECLNDWD